MSKPPPARYRTTNWSSYNGALRKRGSRLVWVDQDMAWLAPQEARLGRPPVVSDAAIQFCLSIKVLFKLPLRQSTGMVASLLRLAGLDWSVPDFSTLCRRQKTLAVQIPCRRAAGPLNLLVDDEASSGRLGCAMGPSDHGDGPRTMPNGIKFLGDGKWRTREHGPQGRRQWHKVHPAMDTATSDIRAVGFTPSRDGDSPILPELLGQIAEDDQIGIVTADGAYDTRRCHAAIADRQATPFGHSLEPMAFVPSLRSGRTGASGRKIVRRRRLGTRRCAPQDTTVARSGSTGPDTMPGAVSKRRCAASKHSASAPLQETPTARPPRSTSVSHS